ncbi:cytochrome d ubiquinol oxidase subunit II [Pelagibaculum spongiae]|uniref:Cytochrome d ubiquinol oxidase subunit II n=1 Tax=Pelagibaculum spongiae TaxID=2080658 RepID=A0A2V1GX27_9GAMM|nr:cytochrome d ubiquinol oxidase subunit II [Pelagibaculum spongiae]PVZ70560.1 cytochrome d ubiquinol oxidase subunit II [Pelagibaculum spongiae]
MVLDYEMLKLAWWVLIGVLLIGFVITDGMDMGAGALIPFLGKTDEERRVIINTIAPHWDGNQVWLVTAGGAIFAAWPMVYAAAFSGFYFAMFLALFALFFRPVGFDYRSKIDDPRWRKSWDWGLFVGGAVPPLIFGIAFGNLLQGVPFYLDDLMRTHYDGGFFGLLNPFALLAGVVAVSMTIMHGASWLFMRADKVIADRARKVIWLAALVLIATFSLAGFWLWSSIDGYQIVSMPSTLANPNPLAKEVELVAGGWFANYIQYPWMIAAPTLAYAGALLALLMALVKRPALSFLGTSLAQTGVILTAGFSMFPFLMPSSINPNSSLTMWDATSSELTLTIMFWVAMIFVPIILSYTLWCYYKMWGRVTVDHVQANSHSLY